LRSNLKTGGQTVAIKTRTKVEFARRLAQAGYEDFLVLEKDDAESVLTPKRQELLETIATEDIESITDLANRLDRDVSIVHRDLDLLFKYSLVAYEESGGRKAPYLKHEHVFVEPLV
jgi:predicted transcriptional regulator